MMTPRALRPPSPISNLTSAIGNHPPISNFTLSISNPVRFLLPVVLILTLAGCASGIFPAYNPAGRNVAGQVLYQGKKRTFIGEFTVRQSPTDFALDVTKGPGVELILIRESGDSLVQVEALGHSWHGNPQHFVPPQVRNWVALRDVFSGGSPPGANVTRGPNQISVVFANGERFVFHING